MKPVLDQQTLKRVLIYDPRSGEWVWRIRSDVSASWNTRYAGKRAGYRWRAPKSAGKVYRLIRIFDYPFFEHRLAVLYMTGEWPTETVDHEDQDGENNKWSNLRQATNVQNCANRGRTTRNTTGFKGVSVVKKTGRFRATIQFAGKWRQIGIFSTAEEAAAAYQMEALRLAGEFARS